MEVNTQELSTRARALSDPAAAAEMLMTHRGLKVSALTALDIYKAALLSVAAPRHNVNYMIKATKTALRAAQNSGDLETAGVLLGVLEVLSAVAAVQHLLVEFQDVLGTPKE